MKTIISISGALLLATRAAAFALDFSPGDIAVFQITGTAALTNVPTPINIVELNPIAPGQAAPVQSIIVPSSGTASDLTASGTATSTGYLHLTGGSSELAFTGHKAAAGGAANANTITARGVGAIDSHGTYSLAASYTGASGNQTRSAASNDGVNFYIGDQGGVYENGGSAAIDSPATNIRTLAVQNSQLYGLNNSATAGRLVQYSPALPAFPATGVSPTASAFSINNGNDVVLVSSGAQGLLVDTAYVSTTTGIAKFSFDGTSWTVRGTATVTGVTSGLFGIGARRDAITGFDIVATSGDFTKVVSFQDTAAFSSNIALVSTAANILYTAPTNTTFRGVDFAPATVPEPSAFMLLSLGLLACGQRFLRRKRA